MTLTLPVIIISLIVVAAVIIFIITRYATVIGRFLLITGGLIIALILAFALITQGAATLKQAQATDNAVKTVKTMATTQAITATAGACVFGGLTTITTVSLIIAVALYYRHKLTTEQAGSRAQIVTTSANPTPPPLTQPPTYYPPQPTGIDIAKIDLEKWGW